MNPVERDRKMVRKAVEEVLGQIKDAFRGQVDLIYVCESGDRVEGWMDTSMEDWSRRTQFSIKIEGDLGNGNGATKR
jgi:hypothetical protein